MKQIPAICVVLLIIVNYSAAQGLAINTDGTTAHASAMLDIKNPNKGLLIPRVNLVSDSDVVTIPTPRLSLLIYNNNAALPDGDGYYYWNGNKWSKFATRTNLANLAWNTGGNTGTNGNINFIGTTDDKPLVFKTNNILSGKIDPALDNTFFGQSSGLNITTGGANSFYGNTAGTSTTTGCCNTATGYSALYSNSTGTYNTATGVFALHENIGGYQNTATGYLALQNNTSGFYNAATGVMALMENTTGHSNTAMGLTALLDNLSGNGNTAVGVAAMQDNETGDFNTAIGYSAGPSLSSLTNSTAVGYNTHVATNNTMVFGNYFVDRWAFGISTTNAQHALEVGVNGNNGNGAYLTQGGVWTNTSDADKKEDFSSLDRNELLQKISNLNIQRWKYKGTNEYHIGPTAQDFYKAFNVGTDNKGISTVDPAGISLLAIQELIKENKSLRAELDEIKQLLKKATGQ